MTTQRYERCRHCGIRYIFTASGAGCGDPLNSGTLCPDCKAIEREALRVAFANVPRLFECRYQDVREIPEFAWITLDIVRAWEAEREDDDDRYFGLTINRIFSPSYDLDGDDVSHSREVRGGGQRARGYRFKVTTWRVKRDYLIELPREYDLIEQRFTGYDWPHPKRRPDPRFNVEPLAEPALPPPRPEQEGK